MSSLRFVQVTALVALLIPLSGCIGGDDDTDPSGTIDGTDIAEGIPPAKFTFEPEQMDLSGKVVRETDYKEGAKVPVIEYPLSDDTVLWRIKWNVSGLTPVGVGEEGLERGEAWYQFWVGYVDEEADDGYRWEKIAQSVAPNGFFSGSSAAQQRFGYREGDTEVSATMVSIESADDSKPEIRLLTLFEMEPADPDSEQDGDEKEWPLDVQKPFAAVFADAKVQVSDSGAVNISVTAVSLPQTDGLYDLFIRSGENITYLGTLTFDAAAGGHTFATSPDPELFTRYQFFISLEAENGDEELAQGFTVMTSKFGKLPN